MLPGPPQAGLPRAARQTADTQDREARKRSEIPNLLRQAGAAKASRGESDLETVSRLDRPTATRFGTWPEEADDAGKRFSNVIRRTRADTVGSDAHRIRGTGQGSARRLMCSRRSARNNGKHERTSASQDGRSSRRALRRARGGEGSRIGSDFDRACRPKAPEQRSFPAIAVPERRSAVREKQLAAHPGCASQGQSGDARERSRAATRSRSGRSTAPMATANGAEKASGAEAIPRWTAGRKSHAFMA